MKTIFRTTSVALFFAATIALGAVVGYAQDPCADADGQTALGDKFRALYPKTSVDDRKAAIDAGKQFLEKYGSCESAKELADYLKTAIPRLEEALAKVLSIEKRKKIVADFTSAVPAKRWDDVYANGKLLLAESPDEFRAVELVMGSIGLDETAKSPRVTKWNDETLRYAKMSIADLEGGKKFPQFGFGKDYTYQDKADALAWMNYTIGYIMTWDKNDKRGAAPYLYKASQATTSNTSKTPQVYQAIASFYFDEVNRLIKEVKDMVADQKDTDTADVAKQKADAIKAKIGILNGTSERAIDAYGRALDLATNTKTPSPQAYRDGLQKTINDLYNVRFAKTEGVNAWVASSIKKPFADPTTPVTPVIDPEPSTATTPTTPSTTPGGVRPGTPKPVVPPVKPATPAPKPAGSKPGAVSSTKSAVVKRSTAR